MPMASTSKTPSSTSKIPREIHDVFLNFRGEDTRYTFTGHLHAALNRLKIRTYIDDELERGDEISPSLLKAIEEAKVSVIVFSENYASSRWCLDELEKIVECKRKNGQIIVPVFYHINPTQVRNQTGSYALAFAEHEKRFAGNVNKVQTWRLALAEAASISGWDCLTLRMECELVEKIAEDILEKLDCINGGGLERRLAMYKKMAQEKLDKSLRTGDMNDLEDLIETLNELAQLKLEKALHTNDPSVWEDLFATHERILQHKDDKLHLAFSTDNMQDVQKTRHHFEQIQRELARRKNGIRGI